MFRRTNANDEGRPERTVLDFVKRGKVRRGALEATLNEADEHEPGRLEKALAEFARARARLLSEGEKQQCI